MLYIALLMMMPNEDIINVAQCHYPPFIGRDIANVQKEQINFDVCQTDEMLGIAEQHLFEKMVTNTCIMALIFFFAYIYLPSIRKE